MENFALIDTLRQYCTDNNIIFVYGNEDYSNAVLQWEVDTGNPLTDGQLVLFAGFEYIPILINSVIDSIQYSGFLSLGRHCETTTSSSLDETPIQKYDRRIKDLLQRYVQIISEFSCANGLEVLGGITISEKLNVYDQNMDTVGSTITWQQ